MNTTKKSNNILEEVEIILKKIDAGIIEIDLDLKPVSEGEREVGRLTKYEIALLVYQEQLIELEFELAEMEPSVDEFSDSREIRLRNILKRREELVESLFWDCILSRFPGEDETTLEMRADFRIVKNGGQMAVSPDFTCLTIGTLH